MPVTVYGGSFHCLLLTLHIPRCGPATPRYMSLGLGCSAFARHYLRNRSSLSLPPLTEMFHFSGYRSYGPMYSDRRKPDITPAGFPHSEIHGSKRACRSPWLIAACYVLHRLLSPRHSPCALSNLITNLSV